MAEGVTANSAHPVDAVQIVAENFEGVAGAVGLTIRSENGVTTRIGTGVLSRKVALLNTTATVAAPYVVTAEESGKVFVANNAAAMCQFTLPTPVAGLTYTFANVPVQGMRIRAAGGGRIRLGASLGAVNAAIETVTAGDTIVMVAITAVNWHIIGGVLGFTAIA